MIIPPPGRRATRNRLLCRASGCRRSIGAFRRRRRFSSRELCGSVARLPPEQECILRGRPRAVAEFDGRVIAMPINDAAFEYLLARAGLVLTDAEKAELKTVCDGIAAMAE